MGQDQSDPASDPHGHDAPSPWSMPWAAWREVLTRSWREASDDNLGLIAAGVAYYAFLALVPLIAATVLVYGLAAEPDDVIRDIGQLATVLPGEAAKLIGNQLMQIVQTSGGKKGFGLLLALGIALFGARSAAGSIITALNVAYEEKEKRGFIKVNLLALAMTGAGVMVVVLAVLAAGVVARIDDWLGSPVTTVLIRATAAIALLLVAAGAAATLYRYGPSRDKAKWTWLTPGSVLFAVVWIAATAGFGFYASRFGKYNATYGSLGAVVVLLTWLYLSAYVLMFGAELNSELEHQTAQDTTAGPAQPLGARDAWAADHVAGTGDDPPPEPAQVGEPRRAPPPPPRRPPGWLATLAVIGLVAIKKRDA